MSYRETTASSQDRSYFKTLFALLLGGGAVIVSVSLASYGPKSLLGVVAALVAVVLLSSFASQRLLTGTAIVCLGLGIPFNLDANFFYRAYVGVTSVDVGLTLLSALALSVIFLLERAQKPAQPSFRYNKTLFWAPLLYMIAGVMSFYNASSPELVVLELVRLSMLFVIFLVVMNLQSRRQINLFVVTLSIGVVLEALIAGYQYTTGHTLGLSVIGEGPLVTQNVGYAVSRATGTIIHPNSLAYYFELLIPLMLAMSLFEEKTGRKLWYLLALMCGLGGIVLTLSRGGWVAVPVSILFVLAASYRRRMTGAKMHGFLFLAVLSAIIFAFLVYPTVERRLNFTDYGTARTRLPLNRAAVSIIEQFPVTGVGLNNLARVFRTYDTTGGSSLLAGGMQHVVHNLYLCVWAETGTIGIVMFLWMFFAVFLLTARNLFKVPPQQRAILVGVSAGLLAHMIHGLFDPGFRVLMSTSMEVYGLMGLAGAAVMLPPNTEE